jgi:hypothetical protein
MSTATAQAIRPDSSAFRQTVLTSARRFKSTWVELGKLLIQVRDEALFQEWGFDSFESYCYKELHIRKATAMKLTRSFAFLAKHEPKTAVSEQAANHAPAFEVVEVLAQADERGQLSADEYKNIRDSIWNPEKPVAELKRDLEERFPRPVHETGTTFSASRLAAQARRLADALSATKQLPRAIAERAGALAEEVEEWAAQEKQGR